MSFFPKKFPLAAKALKELEADIEGSLYWTIGEMGCTALPPRVAEIVDTTITGTQAEKEALIIGAFYQLAPERLLEAEFDPAAPYGADVDVFVKKLAQAASATIDGKPLPLDQDTARVAALVGISITEQLLEMIKDGADISPKKLTAAEFAQAKNQLLDEQDKVVAHINAPALEALHRQVMDALILDLQSQVQPAKAAPKNPRKNAPGP